MTLRELWEDFERQTIIPCEETPHEVAIQKLAFACGAVAVLGTLCEGVPVDLDDHERLMFEAFAAMNPDRDRRRTEPSPN